MVHPDKRRVTDAVGAIHCDPWRRDIGWASTVQKQDASAA
jgi:hypothetical protein